MDVGLDRLPRLTSLVAELRAAPLAVLAHPASVNRSYSHISGVLSDLDITPVRFFGPEHGYGGEAQDMVGVEDARDPRTNAPIISLYGENYDDLIPKGSHFKGVETLLIDLADVGSRYYTYIWTALLAVKAAAEAGVRSVILDRPNPLGQRAADCEGQAIAPGFESFVGLRDIAVRHGLTLGEIVPYFAEKEGLSLGAKGQLGVVRVEHSSGGYADGWDRDFVFPSPNMPTLDTAVVYPGGCLLEGTNLSEGRGTTRPFELVGAPYLDGHALAQELNACPLEGFIARPLTFMPTFQKHARQVCGGVQIHVVDRDAFRPFATYLALIGFAHHQAPNDFQFRTERYEFVDTIPALDLLTGDAAAREAMVAGEDPVEIANKAATVSPEFLTLREAAQDAKKRAAQS